MDREEVKESTVKLRPQELQEDQDRDEAGPLEGMTVIRVPVVEEAPARGLLDADHQSFWSRRNPAKTQCIQLPVGSGRTTPSA